MQNKYQDMPVPPTRMPYQKTITVATPVSSQSLIYALNTAREQGYHKIKTSSISVDDNGVATIELYRELQECEYIAMVRQYQEDLGAWLEHVLMAEHDFHCSVRVYVDNKSDEKK